MAKFEVVASEERRERFLREGRAAARLAHPNIVPVFDSGQDGTHHYIASSFIRGRSLHSVLEELPEGQTLELHRAVQIVRKLAEALAYAHKNGIIHRDVKPANVMLTDEDEPMLADFGLAMSVAEERMTHDGRVLGTVEYMAPEQGEGKAQAASDQYSLGCILFEMLTGRLPFTAASAAQYLVQHKTVEAPSPSQFRQDLPRDLVTICQKCVEKDPGNRYEDCQALADDLRRCQEGEPIRARRLNLVERGARWVRREPRLAGALVVAVAALIGVAVVLGVSAEKQRELNGKLAQSNNQLQTETNDKEKANDELTKSNERLREEKSEREKANEKLKETLAQFQAEQAAKERQYRTSLYAKDYQQAVQAIQNKDLVQARSLLGNLPVDLQGWEWAHAMGWCERVAMTLTGHTVTVFSVSISPDGKRIVSGSGDKTVKVWDAASGQELLSLNGHTDFVRSVSISPDGKWIVSGSWDNTVKVWDAATGQELLSLKGHTGHVSSVSISPDGKRIVSGSGDNTVKVWDAATGQELLSLKGHTGYVLSVSISPDGKRIVSGSEDKTVKVWDAATGQELLSLKGHTGPVTSVSISPDDKRIVSGSDDKTVKVWDAASGQELLSLKGHTQPVFSVSISPDGKRIVSGSWDKTVKVWDAASGQKLLSLKGHTGVVWSVSISPDGKRIVSSSSDKTVKVWDAASGQELLSLKGHTGYVFSVSISPDGKRVIGQHGTDRVLIWDAQTGQLLQHASDRPATGGKTHRVSPDGRYHVWVDGTLVWLQTLPDPATVEQQRRRLLAEAVAFDSEYHRRQAALAQEANLPFTAAFHLERLLAAQPAARSTLLTERNSLLQAMRKSDPRDAFPVSPLARSAVWAPGSVEKPEMLLPLFAASTKERPTQLEQRIHAGLLLRTGSAKDALPLLQAALKSRPEGAPPVEELLLALTYHQLKQPAEARNYLDQANRWLDRGRVPLRAASLSGALGGSWACGLATLLGEPEHPNLNPMDWETRLELETLQAEAEKILADKP